MSTILIVDDEPSIRKNLQKFLAQKGHSVNLANDGKAALEFFKKEFADLVLLDLHLPDLDGVEVLRRIKKLSPSTSVIMITAYGDIETAVKSIQLKAENFLIKPVDLKVLEAVVDKCLENCRNQEEINYLRRTLTPFEEPLIKDDVKFPPEIYHAIKLLAKNCGTNVLILGETGTGKGLVAKTIHELSARGKAPFMEINCAGLSRELLESELFGHEQGAFTDAKSFKKGLMEIADGGTVFLDEVSELSLGVQAKLLKVIEQKTFRRLGGVTNIKVDIRIMAATNLDLEKAVLQKTFREDIYYRLCVMPIRLPALRHRKNDILSLANIFLQELNSQFGKEIKGFAADADSAILNYYWPGNIRELKNIVERAVLICEQELINLEHLPDNLYAPKEKPETFLKADLARKSLKSLEKERIAEVLKKVRYNRTETAKILGIHRSTLINKIRKYHLD